MRTKPDEQCTAEGGKQADGSTLGRSRALYGNPAVVGSRPSRPTPAHAAFMGAHRGGSQTQLLALGRGCSTHDPGLGLPSSLQALLARAEDPMHGATRELSVAISTDPTALRPQEEHHDPGARTAPSCSPGCPSPYLPSPDQTLNSSTC